MILTPPRQASSPRPRCVGKTVLLDDITPVAAYAALRRVLPGPSFLLESAPAPQECARHSIVGFGAIGELVAQNGDVMVRTPGQHFTGSNAQVLAMARELVDRCRPEGDIDSPFLGAYGVAGFELADYFERVHQLPPNAQAGPDLHLVIPQTLLVFDHFTHLGTVLRIGSGDFAQDADEILDALHGARLAEVVLAPPAQPVALQSSDHFTAIVSTAREAILDGEAFQIVLSQGWRVRSDSEPFDVYRSLRSINPSPYMFYLDFGDGQLLGSSPEALCRLAHGRAQIRPLAGTRPRHRDPSADRVAANELMRDPKERAEHLMLVDLARNDLGRTCEYGSVEAADLFTIERYSHVMHLASDVRGSLRAELDAFDLFAAAFPAGTVSGAPKIRALQLIAELEGERRGFYGGSVVRFGFDGGLDACITLRAAHARDGTYVVRAGAGIVADSQPETEDAECRAKASAVLMALGIDEVTRI